MGSMNWVHGVKRTVMAWVLAVSFGFSAVGAQANQLSWKTVAPLPVATAEGAAGVVNNRIFLLGGSTAPGASAAVGMYDPAGNAWQARPSLVEPRFDGAAATLGDTVYIAGGQGAPGAESGVLAYNTADGASSIVGTLAIPRTRAGAAIVNNRLYVVGGSAAGADSIEEFDLGTKTAVVRRALPAARQWASVVALAGKIYIVGGLDGSGKPVATCWEYDPATNGLADKRAMPVAVAARSAVTANGKIYVIGGITASAPSLAWTPAIRAFDPAANRWEAVGYLRASRHGQAAAVIGTSLYVAGGESGAGYLAVHETAPLAPAGTVWSWSDVTAPAAGVTGLEGITAIAQGDDHRVALMHDGTVWTWGADGAGQLGGGGDLTVPRPIPSLSGVVAIAAGKAHTSVLTASGAVREYGNYWRTPRTFAATGFAALSGGDFYTVALKGDGTVWTWTYTDSPAQVAGLTDIVAIAAGRSFSPATVTDLALAADGTVWAWGINNPVPAPVSGLANVVAIASSAGTMAALKEDGTVWRWSPGTLPVQVPGLPGAIDVTAASALQGDGGVWDWSNPAAPGQISGLSGAFALTAKMALIPYSTPIIFPSQMPFGTRGASYSHPLSIFGALFPYTCSLSAGSLPPGLALSGGDCTIAGTPTTVGSYSFTVRAVDGAGAQAVRDITMGVYEPLVITTASLPAGRVGVPYSTIVAAAGGKVPYSWSLVSGALPGGLALDGATGIISGTPTLQEAATLVLQATDANGATATAPFAVSIYPPPLVITASLPSATTGAAYSRSLTATGGVPPYLWGVTAGSLPPGLSLNGATGAISGTPTVAGVYTATITVTDTFPDTASQPLTLTVKGTIHVPELPPADYPNVQAAYGVLPDGGTIELQALAFSGDLSCNRPVTVSLKGGYSPGNTGNGGYTTLQGSVTVANGTVTVENLIIR